MKSRILIAAAASAVMPWWLVCYVRFEVPMTVPSLTAS
jgi:hypothetical protein